MATGTAPISLPVAPPKIVTPTRPLPIPGSSLASVPIKLPTTTLPDVAVPLPSDPEMSTPPQPLSVIVLPSPTIIPPIVFPVAPPKISTPS